MSVLILTLIRCVLCGIEHGPKYSTKEGANQVWEAKYSANVFGVSPDMALDRAPREVANLVWEAKYSVNVFGVAPDMALDRVPREVANQVRG